MTDKLFTQAEKIKGYGSYSSEIPKKEIQKIKILKSGLKVKPTIIENLVQYLKFIKRLNISYENPVFYRGQVNANYLLNPSSLRNDPDMDHLVLEKLKPQGYVRYMDDVIIFDNLKSRLMEIYRTFNNYVATELQLTFKQPVINKCVNGIPFLGFLIRRNSISILSKNWNRKLKKVAQLDKNYSEENEFDTYNRYSSMFACLALCQK